MELNWLFDAIHQYGYAALFFALWLGVIGMPIPDELIVMGGGLAVSTGLLHPLPAFLLTYLGVVSGLSIGYVGGRLIGAPLLERLLRKKKLGRSLERAQLLLARRGKWALCLSYFLPVVRHLVPYLVGMNKMPFRQYALYSYTIGFVWTLGFYLIGYLCGGGIVALAQDIHTYGMYALGVALLATLLYGVVRKGSKKYTTG